MRPGPDIRRQNGSAKFRAVILAITLPGIFLFARSPGWADGPTERASPAGTIVARLQYREVDFAPLCVEVQVTRRASFTREPVFASTRVFRGQLVLDQDTNRFLPFAWDIGERKLYLDLNRNGDLTDDPPGALSGSDGELQLFRGIRLRFTSENGPYEVSVDAHIFEQGGRARVFLYVRSLWEGAVELNGKKWYLAVIDRADGRIGPTASLKEIGDRMILRPWEDRDRPCLWWHATLGYVHDLSHVKLVSFPFRYAGNAEVFDAFNLPENLFVQGQAYRLEYRPEREAKLAVTFAPSPAPLGRLHLSGDYIRRVVLDGGANGFTAVLEAPATEVEIPAGVYPRQVVLLHRTGFTNVAVGLGTNRLSVNRATEATLTAGGPLQNVVAISPRPSAGQVSLHYQLTNASGIHFRLAFQDEKAPPRLEIRQGDNLVAQGRFEFG